MTSNLKSKIYPRILEISHDVIPAKAGIQNAISLAIILRLLDSRFRGNDVVRR